MFRNQPHPNPPATKIKDILNGFMTAALLEKPEDVFLFARAHFAGADAEYVPQDSRALSPFALTGPAGVGRSTLIRKLQTVFPGQFVEPLCHLSRSPREGEVDGERAHFVSAERLTADIENK